MIAGTGWTGQLDVRSDVAAMFVGGVLVGGGAVLICWVFANWGNGVFPQAESRSKRQPAMSRNQGFFE